MCLASCGDRAQAPTDTTVPVPETSVQDSIPDSASPDLPDRAGEAGLPDQVKEARADFTDSTPDVEQETWTDGLLDLVPDLQPEPCPSFVPGTVSGTVASDDVVEASGLVASRVHPGVLWTHNDSGDKARFFALSTTGAHLGVFFLQGAKAYDWEDMALGTGPDPELHYLLIADIGDNAVAREEVTVFRTAEPPPGTPGAPANTDLPEWDQIHLAYPDGPHDAEAFFSDSLSGDWFIVTKVMKGDCDVYRAPFPQNPEDGPIQLQHLGSLPFEMATAADMSPDGTLVIIRSYVHAQAFARPPDLPISITLFAAPCPLPLAPEFQGETLAFAADNSGYFTLSEGTAQNLWWFESSPGQ